MRKIVLLSISVIMAVMLCGINAFAIEPIYTYVSLATSTLNIVSDTAYCKASVVGSSSVKSTSGTMYLEKKGIFSWKTVNTESWTDSSSYNTLHMENSLSGLSSGKYRVRTVFTVYSGNSSETVEAISIEESI